MRVMMINWSSPSGGTAEGGGVTGYAHALSREFVGRGHRVSWLTSGQRYRPDAPCSTTSGRSAPLGTCCVEQRDMCDGIEMWDVVNSPVLSPARVQFASPGVEISSPMLERTIEAFVRKHEPDVVHIHNVEGFSSGLVSAVRRGRSAAAIVCSLHNYHTLCSQVNLMQRETFPCHDFDQGHACRGCLSASDPVAVMRERAGVMIRVPAAEVLSPKRERVAPAPLDWSNAPDSWNSGYADPLWCPVDNDVRPVPENFRPLHQYGRRRTAFVAMLSACDHVLAVSTAVRDRFAHAGVSNSIMSVMTIGTTLADTPRRTAVRTSSAMLRLCFLGNGTPMKGMPMLLDSLELLGDDVLAQIELVAYGRGVEALSATTDRLMGRIRRITINASYRAADLPAILSDVDVGVVPSIWWDNGPQTVLEMLACGVPVLGARLGGIPDFVSHGRNGLLFRGNDRFDCARQIARLVREPGLREALRDGVRPPQSMISHARDMLEQYEQVRAHRLRIMEREQECHRGGPL